MATWRRLGSEKGFEKGMGKGMERGSRMQWVMGKRSW